MKKLNILLLMLLALAVSCDSTNDSDCINGSGEIFTLVHEHSGATKFTTRISDNIKVYLHQGATKKIEIHTDKNLLQYIEFEVNDDEIIIYDNTTRNLCATQFDIHIWSENIKEVNAEGSVEVYNQTPLNLNELKIECEGSINVNLSDITTEILALYADGSARITASGSTDAFICAIKGSGEIDNTELEASTAHITIQGSGLVNVWVKDQLYILIEGSGTVRYKGDPEKDINILGTGDVEQLP